MKKVVTLFAVLLAVFCLSYQTNNVVAKDCNPCAANAVVIDCAPAIDADCTCGCYAQRYTFCGFFKRHFRHRFCAPAIYNCIPEPACGPVCDLPLNEAPAKPLKREATATAGQAPKQNAAPAPKQNAAPAPKQNVAPAPAPVSKPTVTPAPAPVSKPTVTPAPAPVSKPTVAPAPAPVSKPTVTPAPAPVSKPTVAPAIAPVSKPTVTPAPAPVSKPTVTPAPVPDAKNATPAAKTSTKIEIKPADAKAK